MISNLSLFRTSAFQLSPQSSTSVLPIDRMPFSQAFLCGLSKWLNITSDCNHTKLYKFTKIIILVITIYGRGNKITSVVPTHVLKFSTLTVVVWQKNYTSIWDIKIFYYSDVSHKILFKINLNKVFFIEIPHTSFQLMYLTH